jgi:hypothetical protein
MSSSIKCFSFALIILLMLGCGPRTLYTWEHYDNHLYGHYKDPAQKERFIEALKEVVNEAEASGKVPPGIYAEYGYVLYEQGNGPMAIQYFQKEAEKWPESRIFMTKMIAIVQKGNKKKEDKARLDTIDAGAKQINLAPAEVTP